MNSVWNRRALQYTIQYLCIVLIFVTIAHTHNSTYTIFYIQYCVCTELWVKVELCCMYRGKIFLPRQNMELFCWDCSVIITLQWLVLPVGSPSWTRNRRHSRWGSWGRCWSQCKDDRTCRTPLWSYPRKSCTHGPKII
jgi:hypothetical protein